MLSRPHFASAVVALSLIAQPALAGIRFTSNADDDLPTCATEQEQTDMVYKGPLPTCPSEPDHPPQLLLQPPSSFRASSPPPAPAAELLSAEDREKLDAAGRGARQLLLAIGSVLAPAASTALEQEKVEAARKASAQIPVPPVPQPPPASRIGVTAPSPKEQPDRDAVWKNPARSVNARKPGRAEQEAWSAGKSDDEPPAPHAAPRIAVSREDLR